MARPRAVLPAVSSTTGMSRAAAAASTARIRPGSRSASRTSASTRVPSILNAYPAYCPAPVTSSWPEETARVKPSARRVRSSAENTEPEWVTSATGPRGSGSGSRYPTARSPRAALTNPMQPAPHTAMPAADAVAASRARSPGRWPGGWPGGSKALPKITAERSPRAAASASCSSRAVSGTASRTRSTGPGRSARDGWQGIPAISWYRGLTRYVRGAGWLRATSLIIRWPRLPGRGLAPTSATLRASSMARSAGLTPGTGAAAGSFPAAAPVPPGGGLGVRSAGRWEGWVLLVMTAG